MGFFCSELDYGMTGCSGECCFRMMYIEWYGVCNFGVLRWLRYVLTIVVCMCFMCFYLCIVSGV